MPIGSGGNRKGQKHPLVLSSASKLTVIKLGFFRTASELLGLRPLWEKLCCGGSATIFQNFELNCLAAHVFAEREEPFIISAEASYGAAIIPAVLRQGDRTIRLLGEELFDYRAFLQQGESEVLCFALAALAKQQMPLEIVALRSAEAHYIPEGLQLHDFAAAPGIKAAEMPEQVFSSMHLRLARNLRRLQRLGYEFKSYNGTHSSLLAEIYKRKASQDRASLFHDALRVSFMTEAALSLASQFEIFTLECGGHMAAALVTLRDDPVRRFYTGWFAPELSKHSPCLSLMYEVTRQSLAAGLDCDYMTGEQPYKLRLANSAAPLFRLRATPEELSGLTGTAVPELHLAS